MNNFRSLFNVLDGIFHGMMLGSIGLLISGFVFGVDSLVIKGLICATVTAVLMVCTVLGLMLYKLCYKLYQRYNKQKYEEQPYNEEYKSTLETINPKQDTAYICFTDGKIELIKFVDGLVLDRFGRQIGIVLHPTYFKIQGRVFYLNEWRPNQICVCKTVGIAVDITSLEQIKTRKMYSVYVDNQCLKMEEDVSVIDNKCYTDDKEFRRYEGTIKEYVECMGYNKLDVIEDDNSVLTFHPERYKVDGNNLVKA